MAAPQDIVKAMFTANPILHIDRSPNNWKFTISVSGRTWVGICAVILSVTSPPVILEITKLAQIILT